MHILLYTENNGKLAEFKTLFEGLDLIIKTPKELHVDTGVAETGHSFVENALIKARDGAQQTDMACVADDSGLIVDCLNGAPGIYSSRYAGEKATDQENCEKLMQELANQPLDKRTARYHCTLVLLRNKDDPCPMIAHGTLEGHIHLTARGDNGFGYDPLFWPIGMDRSVAEMDPEVKHSISHRGQALRQLHHLISTNIAQKVG